MENRHSGYLLGKIATEQIDSQAFILILGGLIVLSIVLAARAIAVGSWKLMWTSSVCLLVASLNGFYLGVIMVLVLCQLIAVATGLRWDVSPRAWTVLRLLGLLVWVIVIPGQVLLIVWLDWSSSYAFLAITVLWVLTPLLPLGRVFNGQREGKVTASP